MQEAVTPYIWYGVISMFLLGAFLFLEEEMATIVKFISMFEMPLTKSQKQHACESSVPHRSLPCCLSSFVRRAEVKAATADMGKCFFFYVIYHLLLSTVLLGVLAATVKIDHEHHGGGAVELWVESVGMFHQNRCVSQLGAGRRLHIATPTCCMLTGGVCSCFVTACVIDLFHVMEGLKFFTRPAHTLTPEEQGKFRPWASPLTPSPLPIKVWAHSGMTSLPTARQIRRGRGGGRGRQAGAVLDPGGEYCPPNRSMLSRLVRVCAGNTRGGRVLQRQLQL